jgi:hypothetical protein
MASSPYRGHGAQVEHVAYSAAQRRMWPVGAYPEQASNCYREGPLSRVTALAGRPKRETRFGAKPWPSVEADTIHFGTRW